MSNGPASDQAPVSEPAEPLPRRGGGGARTGRIPTQYGPGNPIRKQPDKQPEEQPEEQPAMRPEEEPGFRITPGEPDRPTPRPQHPAAPSEGERSTVFAVRPGAPEDNPPTASGQAATASATHADFVAMAERGESARRRKRRLRLATALVATGCVAAVGGTLLATGSAGRQHTAAPKSRATAAAPTTAAAAPSTAPTTAAPTAAPSASAAPASLLAVLSAASSDSAPLTAAGLFPARATGPGGQVYSLVATTGSGCAPAVTPPLAAVLAKNGCEQVFRASYTSGGTAVTVGIAVFAAAGPAAAVKSEATGNVESLAGGPLHPFCRGVVCRLSVNSVGRYAYFTVAGYTDGKPVPAADTLALTAGADMERLVIQSLQARARAEAARAGASAG